MELNKLTAITPIDGRYRDKVEVLDNYFSEFALIRYRVLVEIEYFIALCESSIPSLNSIDKKFYKKLRYVYIDFSYDDALKIKHIEKTTNHDVKAVEYFLKEKFEEFGISEYKEFIHFGLTSQDINNTAVPYSLQDSVHNVFSPSLERLISKLGGLAADWANIPMLARTHGQAASPTCLGKEIDVFIERIQKQKALLNFVPFSAKFGGATGNFNAHKVAYPEIDWIEFANSFVNHVLNLERSQTTTQIEHYDNIAALFDNLKRINTILIDLSRDIWTYISIGYFKQKIKKGEIGSSAMPHKVNPIDFENAEGNLGMANAVYEHLSQKLPISRLQRDLTDSTVLRNIGIPFSHTIIAIESLLKGLDKLVLNEQQLEDDLNDNWAVVAEAIQTILRRENYPKPYETLLDLTRTNEKITKDSIHHFIDKLEVSDKIKAELKNISPFNFVGYASNE